MQRELFQLLLHESGFESAAEIPQITQAQAVILSGLLIFADWLSSTEYLDDNPERPLFPLVSLTTDLSAIDEQARIEAGIEQWARFGQWVPQKVRKATDLYQQIWGFAPRPVQKKVTEVLEHTTHPEMLILEAPMGLGKTETALVAAQQMAFKMHRNGIYFALPTQATSNAMFDRVKDWVEHLPSDGGPHSLHLMHGKAQFNEEFQGMVAETNRVANEIRSEMDDEAADNVLVDEWFTGKKTILDEFTVGTIDNLLQVALKQKHLALKHFGFSSKVVVIDEAHASDLYMDQYLYRALNWLGAYRVPIIILSATLPREKRVGLLDAYYKGLYPKGHKLDEANPDQEWKHSEAYPLLTVLDGDKVVQVDDFGEEGNQNNHELTITKFYGDTDATVNAILTSIKGGGVAGVIVNTVHRAQELAQELMPKVRTVVLHSSFLTPDRAKYEQELQELIGKNGKRPEQLVVVGTQVLEQSLDIDFDILYTDLAPMDLLLQRAGRMHRHDNVARPALLKSPEMVIMSGEDDGAFDSGTEHIYGRYLLMRTEYYLMKQMEQYSRPVIRLPADISHLVQQVYDFTLDPPIDGIEDAKAEFDQNNTIEKGKAKQFCISRPSGSATIHGWLNKRQQDADTNEQRATATVRDIQETLEVILIRREGNKSLLLNGRALEECSDREIAQQLIRLPHAVTIPIDKAINELEGIIAKMFANWQYSKWLRGALVLPLDAEDNGHILNWKLHYSSSLGLTYEKEGDYVHK